MANQEEKATIDTRGGGTGRPAATTRAGHCAVCGGPANGTGRVVERFGEAFCSDAHADQFTEAVRAARVQTAVARTDREATACGGAMATSSGWKASLGRALCWGAPALVLVSVAVIAFGGGGLLVSGAAAVLPLLGALACPLGMYLMMRSMSKTGHQNGREDDGAAPRARPKE